MFHKGGDGIGRARQRVRRNSPAFKVIAERFRASILKNFRLGGWWPEHWVPSPTAAADGRNTLIRRSILKNSFAARWGDSFAACGTAQKYAAVHQFGATIRPKNPDGALHFMWQGADVFVKSVTIPARPMLPVKDRRLHPDDSAFVKRTWGRYIALGEIA